MRGNNGVGYPRRARLFIVLMTMNDVCDGSIFFTEYRFWIAPHIAVARSQNAFLDPRDCIPSLLTRCSLVIGEW
jgi:hypothetical protein